MTVRKVPPCPDAQSLSDRLFGGEDKGAIERICLRIEALEKQVKALSEKVWEEK